MILQPFGTILVLGSVLVLAYGQGEQVGHEQHKTVETTEKRGPLGLLGTKKTETRVEHGQETQRMRRNQRQQHAKKGHYELNQFERDRLLKTKDEWLLFRKVIESYENDPLVELDRQCFAKFKQGQSIDFVVDVAPSPTLDTFDRISADSPVALFWERGYRQPSQAYFQSIQMFIDVVTLEIKPQFTHSIIYDAKLHQKYFLRGRSCDDIEAAEKKRQGVQFQDEKRNLLTLWPHCSKEVHSDLYPIVKNNLGRMTKLALWNRDNGLPTVFSSSRKSKAMYTIVISDGSSGASINDLTDDLSRTTVIDIGNRRFVDKIDWNQFRDIAGTYVLTAPQQLSILSDTVRNLACRLLSNEQSATVY